MSKKQNIVVIVSVVLAMLLLIYFCMVINTMRSRNSTNNAISEIRMEGNVTISDELTSKITQNEINQTQDNHKVILLESGIFTILYIAGLVLFLKKDKKQLTILTLISLVLLLVSFLGIIPNIVPDNTLLVYPACFGLPIIFYLLFLINLKSEPTKKKK